MSEPGGPGPSWDPPPPPPGGHGVPAPPPAPPGGAPPASGYPPAPGHPAGPGQPTAPGYPSQPGYGAQPFVYGSPYPQAPRNDGMAIAALVCGIVAIPMFCGIGLVLGILGIVFGIVSMRKIDRSAGALTGRGLALAGAICGGVGVAFNVIYWSVVIIAAIADSSS